MSAIPLTFHRGGLGSFLTFAFPGGAVALVLVLRAGTLRAGSAWQILLLAIATLALIYGVLMTRRVKLRLDSDGLLISNGLRTYSFKWQDLDTISVRQISVGPIGAMYGLVAHLRNTETPNIAMRVTLMMSGRNKQQLLDALNAELSAREVKNTLPKKAKIFWVGAHGPSHSGSK